jgi:hypothetical protein
MDTFKPIISEAVKDINSKNVFTTMVSKLMHSILQTQAFHRQVKSLSEHLALGDYYAGIDELIDDIVESYQGKNGILSDYTNYEIVNYKNNEQLIKYFEKLEKDIEIDRKKIKESYIQNQIDEIEQLINKTLYKLKFLK